MRSRNDIQTAQDLINEAADRDPRFADVTMVALLDCLCWVLKHPHQTAFGDMLAKLHTHTAIPVVASSETVH